MKQHCDLHFKQKIVIVMIVLVISILFAFAQSQGEEEEERSTASQAIDLFSNGISRVTGAIPQLPILGATQPVAPATETTDTSTDTQDTTTDTSTTTNTPSSTSSSDVPFDPLNLIMPGLGQGISAGTDLVKGFLGGGSSDEQIDTGDDTFDEGIDAGDTSSEGVTNPEALCNDFEGTFNPTEFKETLDDESETIDKDTFKDQWCAFYQNKDKQEVWDGLSETQKTQFMKGLGEQYGVELKGFEKATAWKGNEVTVGGNTISLDLEKFYNEKQFPFEFRGEKGYKYNQRPISSIDATDDGITLTYGSDKDSSKVAIKGKDITFDPTTRQITSQGKKYEWNGQGSLDFDSTTGKMALKFAEGSGDTDITNFAIVRLENGDEVSPYQAESSSQTLPSGVTKPSSGFKVFDGGKKTVDSNGIVRDVKSAEIEIDKSGEPVAIKDAYINKKELNGDLFAQGEFGLSKAAGKKNYFDLSGDVLEIVNDGGILHYKLNQNLKKLDIKGTGQTFIRDGDYVLNFNNNKLESYKLLPQAFQEDGGKFKHTIDEIVNQQDAKNPFSLKKGEDGTIALRDSSGKPVKDDGSVEEEKKDDETKDDGGDGTKSTTTDETKTNPEALKGMKKSGEDEVTIQSQLYLDSADENLVGDGVVTHIETKVSGLGDFPEGLTKEQLIEKLIEDGTINLRVDILDPNVNAVKKFLGKAIGVIPTPKESILISLEKERAPPSIIKYAENVIKDDAKSFAVTARKGDIYFAGQKLPNNVKKEGVTFILGKINDKPKIQPAAGKDGKSIGKIIPQYRDGSRITLGGGDKIYAYYKSLGK